MKKLDTTIFVKLTLKQNRNNNIAREKNTLTINKIILTFELIAIKVNVALSRKIKNKKKTSIVDVFSTKFSRKKNKKIQIIYTIIFNIDSRRATLKKISTNI